MVGSTPQFGPSNELLATGLPTVAATQNGDVQAKQREAPEESFVRDCDGPTGYPEGRRRGRDRSSGWTGGPPVGMPRQESKVHQECPRLLGAVLESLGRLLDATAPRLIQLDLPHCPDGLAPLAILD